MVAKTNKNINNVNYLNITLCFGGHGSTLFISRSHKFQKLLENIADLNDHDIIYYMLRKSHCPYRIRSRK